MPLNLTITKKISPEICPLIFFIVILQYYFKTIIMGATKTEHYTEHQNRIAGYASALGHPARIAIMEHLLRVNACICGDLVNELPLSQPTVSQHLKKLKEAGLIQGTIEGNAVCYCINPVSLRELGNYLTDLIAGMKDATCC